MQAQGRKYVIYMIALAVLMVAGGVAMLFRHHDYGLFWIAGGLVTFVVWFTKLSRMPGQNSRRGCVRLKAKG